MNQRLITLFACCYFIAAGTIAFAQEDVSYKLPPKDIADLLLAKPAPGVSIDSKGEWMALTEISLYPSVEELARPELRLAGLRINPNNYAPSRQTFINNIYLKNIATGKELSISGLPAPLFAGSVSWSPNDKKIAFTHTTGDRVDLYVVDVATQKAAKANKSPLNVLMGSSFQWYDDNTLLYRTALQPATAAPPKPLMPQGPTIQENYGKAAPRPTFQDLIKSPYDEQLFAFLRYRTIGEKYQRRGSENRRAGHLQQRIGVARQKLPDAAHPAQAVFLPRHGGWFSFQSGHCRPERQGDQNAGRIAFLRNGAQRSR